jgi:GntR family transcriptional regulator, transcriptional repressor for pyruvate dehydrogenase complex
MTARTARPRAFQAIVDQVRTDIFGQRLRPGDRLPSEPLLAEQFGVSRTGVREALRVLELQGLVEVRHGYAGGAFVAVPSPTPLVGALEDSLRTGQVAANELYQARLVVEPAIARLAVERDAAALAAALRDNMAHTERALAANEPVSALNREFHRLIAAHADNRVLALMMQALQEMLASQDERYPNAPEVSRGVLAEHQQLLAAIQAGDAAAAESLMRGHLRHLEVRVQHSSASSPAEPSPRDTAVSAHRRSRAHPTGNGAPQPNGIPS